MTVFEYRLSLDFVGHNCTPSKGACMEPLLSSLHRIGGARSPAPAPGKRNAPKGRAVALLGSIRHERTSHRLRINWLDGLTAEEPFVNASAAELQLYLEFAASAVGGQWQRAQGRPESRPATTCQRSARASCYGVYSQFGPRGRDTCSARLPPRPSRSHLGCQTHQTCRTPLNRPPQPPRRSHRAAMDVVATQANL